MRAIGVMPNCDANETMPWAAREAIRSGGLASDYRRLI